MSIDGAIRRGIRLLDTPPDGWVIVPQASTAPIGWRWWSNGKSRFGGEYESALVREEKR